MHHSPMADGHIGADGHRLVGVAMQHCSVLHVAALTHHDRTDAARDDVLAFLHFPQEHWRKIWSTNPLERLNKEIKRRTNVVGIFPNDAAIVRLVGSQLLEQQEEWQLERRRFFSEATMAKIPEPEEPLELTDADPTAQPVASTS